MSASPPLPALASNPLDTNTPGYFELLDMLFAATSAMRCALEMATKAGEEAAALKKRALEAEQKLASARTGERRNIARLLQDAASEYGAGAREMRDELLAVRERVLALEDER
jgi:hypothetical protein